MGGIQLPDNRIDLIDKIRKKDFKKFESFSITDAKKEV
jgi:hypothetical protein